MKICSWLSLRSFPKSAHILNFRQWHLDHLDFLCHTVVFINDCDIAIQLSISELKTKQLYLLKDMAQCKLEYFALRKKNIYFRLANFFLFLIPIIHIYIFSIGLRTYICSAFWWTHNHHGIMWCFFYSDSS